MTILREITTKTGKVIAIYASPGQIFLHVFVVPAWVDRDSRDMGIYVANYNYTHSCRYSSMCFVHVNAVFGIPFRLHVNGER